jgi:hypothetical protein
MSCLDQFGVVPSHGSSTLSTVRPCTSRFDGLTIHPVLSQNRLFVEPVELKDEWHVPFIWDQHAYGVDLSQLRNEAAIRKAITLTESKPVWQLYLETVNSRETPRTVTVRRTIERSGRLDGLAVWFDSGTKEGAWLTTQPSAPQIPWQLSIVRTAPRHFEAGMSVNFKVTPALRGRPVVAIGFRQARSCR